MEKSAPSEVAGLPFVAKVPMSEQDIAFLRKYANTRRGEYKASTVGLLIYAFWFLFMAYLEFTGSDVLNDLIARLSLIVFPLGVVLCWLFMKACRAPFEVIEADLAEAYSPVLRTFNCLQNGAKSEQLKGQV